ncbi:unnamed protein product [Aphanomyces euteiches]
MSVSVRTKFNHRFVYKDFLDSVLNSEGMANRWNTRSPIEEFGMEVGSEVILTVDHADAPVTFSLYNYRQWELYRSLVFDVTSLEGYKESLALTCFHPSTARIVFNPAKDAPNTTYKLQIGLASQYTLQVQSCTSENNQVNASISMVNMGWDNTLSEHMGVEELGLIPIYSVLVVTYALGAISWIYDCLKKRHYSSGINLVFAASLVAETVHCLSKLAYYRAFSVDGNEHSVYAKFRDISESVSNVIFLAFLMLCSLGWSWTRRYLNSQERRFFSVLFAMYLTVALIKASCDPKLQMCQAYMLTEYALKSLMLLGIIIALNYSISRLHVKLDGTRWQGDKIPKLYARLELLRQFRWSFLVYLLLPSFVLIFNIGVINPPGTWKFFWVSCLVEELIMFGIYCHMAYALRPISPELYQMICKSEPSTSD